MQKLTQSIKFYTYYTKYRQYRDTQEENEPFNLKELQKLTVKVSTFVN